jgi:DNA polymerase III delta prime subunit
VAREPVRVGFTNLCANEMFVDKYRPTDYEGYVGDSKSVAAVRALVSCELSTAFSNNIMFYGSPGTGKTTLTNLLMKEIDAECLWTNASDERGVDFIRGAIADFAKRRSISFEKRRRPKWVVLDEADQLLAKAQLSIVTVSDECRGVARILYLVNRVSNMIEPLMSQCTPVRFAPLRLEEQMQKLRDIAAVETSMSLDPVAIRDIARLSKGDMRRSINSLQIATSIAAAHPLPSPSDLSQPNLLSPNSASTATSSLQTATSSLQTATSSLQTATSSLQIASITANSTSFSFPSSSLSVSNSSSNLYEQRATSETPYPSVTLISPQLASSPSPLSSPPPPSFTKDTFVLHSLFPTSHTPDFSTVPQTKSFAPKSNQLFTSQMAPTLLLDTSSRVKMSSDNVHDHLSEPTDDLVTTVIETIHAKPYSFAITCNTYIKTPIISFFFYTFDRCVIHTYTH